MNIAYANNAAAGFDIMSFLPIVLIFAVMYFLVIRPQQKRARQQQEMITALKKGDRVVTTGGIIGVVSKVVNDAEVLVEIAKGVETRVLKSAVSTTLKGDTVVMPSADIAKESSGSSSEGKKSEKKPAGKSNKKVTQDK